MDAFLQLLAWYLCEGSVDRRNGHTCITISQYLHKHIMYDCLRPFNPHLVNGGINIYDPCLNMYFRQFGSANKKYIPDFVKTLSARQIRVFLDAFALGDGEQTKTRKTKLFCGVIYNNYKTSSKRMADDLIEFLVNASYEATREKKYRKSN